MDIVVVAEQQRSDGLGPSVGSFGQGFGQFENVSKDGVENTQFH